MKIQASQMVFLTSAVVAALALASCGGSVKPGEAPVDHPVITGVKVATVQMQSAPDYDEAVGTVRSANISMIATQVMGAVREIRVKEGDRVRAGQLLMLLDDRSMSAQLAKADAGQSEVKQALAEVDQGILAAGANRLFATVTYNRFKDLYEKKSVSRQEFDEVESKYKGAEAMYNSMLAKKEQVLAKQRQASADITSAQTFVSYTRITSPQDGIVTERRVDVGTMAAPGMPLIVVEDPRRYRLEAGIGEETATRVRMGDEVEVRIDGLGPTPIRAKISEVVPAADPMTRTSLLKMDLSPNAGLRSGLYGRVRIPRGTHSGVFLPAAAVLQRGELEYTMAVDTNNVAQLRLVKTAPAADSKREILTGLTAGERVVVEGVERVVDGARIQ